MFNTYGKDELDIFNKTHEQFILGEDLDLFKTLLGTNFDALDVCKNPDTADLEQTFGECEGGRENVPRSTRRECDIARGRWGKLILVHPRLSQHSMN